MFSTGFLSLGIEREHRRVDAQLIDDNGGTSPARNGRPAHQGDHEDPWAPIAFVEWMHANDLGSELPSLHGERVMVESLPMLFGRQTGDGAIKRSAIWGRS